MSVSVLVVDDSPIARKLLRKALPTDWDVQVQEAGDGVEALALFSAARYDVMFLDLTMPTIDGIAVLEALDGKLGDCMVIVVSADVQPGVRQKVLELGAIDFLSKPVHPTALREVLRDYGVMA
jgi:two-component system, chemotaxis family, chemotaxis protein CheY